MGRGRPAAVAAIAMWVCASSQAAPPAPYVPLVDPDLVLLTTPSADGHGAFIRAIDGAKQTVDMTMFHLTNPDVVDALVRAAGRKVAVRVIVDGTGLKPKPNRAAYDKLQSGGVSVRKSSPAFTITHEKGMVVDGKLAFITAINLTRDAARTRDFGVVTRASDVVADVAQLFAADWTNAETGAGTTPAQQAPSLVVAPTTARDKLVALVASAQHALEITVENLGERHIDDAIAAAAHRGVSVRVIVPLCDKNPDPLHDLKYAQELAGKGVNVRMMPAPETPDTPYMHSKMILVDGKVAYVGSVNFSMNSTTKARELGIIFANDAAAAQIHTAFDADWAHAIAPPAQRGNQCATGSAAAEPGGR